MTKEELKYLEKDIASLIRTVEKINFQKQMELLSPQISKNDKSGAYDEYRQLKGYDEFVMIDCVKKLYFRILTYIEAKGLPLLASDFRSNFEDKIKNDKDLKKVDQLHLDEEPELVIIDDFKKYLYSFAYFDYQNVIEAENEKLISILENTPYILQKANSKIVKEENISKNVEWVLDLYFNCEKASKTMFTSVFKYYKPDIIIPELKTAIEYKYVRKGKIVEDYIDQVKTDENGYRGDNKYNNFIAVFCLQNNSITTKEKFLRAWKSKGFSKNWTPVFCNL